MDEYTKQKKFEDVKHPFESLDKIQVLQESKLFTENKPNIKKCTSLITKILYVIGQGVSLRTDEATGLFVQCTMLFGRKSKKLRRMLYLILKELSFSAEQTFIACSSLSTDMNRSNQKHFPFKANVIRTLRAISDLQTFMSLERHFVEALVDQEQSVSSSAIISGLFVSLENIDVVKRWTKQIYSSMKSRFHMSQYHALALMYRLQAKDLLSVSKLILSQSSQFRSPLAHCLLIKYSLKVLLRLKSAEHETAKRLLKFLDTCLTYKNEMIVLSACKTIVKVPYLDDEWINKVIKALRVLLTSFESRTKSVTKFAALRVLASLAEKFPVHVSKCSKDLEKLIRSHNKNVATLAVSTLLKCSSADLNITSLTTDIQLLMKEVPNEYKIDIVKSIRTLIPKSPKNHTQILTLLEKMFIKMDAKLPVKVEIMKTIMLVLEANPKMINKGVLIFCEFIEDCEYDVILGDILHYLGEVGPKVQRPAMCIRFIFNRVFLERPSVRAAATATLVKFAQRCPELKESVKGILKRVINDPNAETRERAILGMKLLDDKVELPKPIVVDIFALEKSLLEYTTDENLHSKPFDLAEAKKKQKEEPKKIGDDDVKKEEVPSALQDDSNVYFEMAESIPQLEKLGKPLKTCDEVLLTEEEGDYVVRCTKHIYPGYIVLQYNCMNNVEEQKLTNVGIEIDVDELEGLSTAFGVNASSIAFHEKQPIIVCLKIDPDNPHPTGVLRSNLTFKIFEEDVDEEDFEESEYELEDLTFTFGDHLLQHPMPEFKEQWAKLGEKNEAVKRKLLPKGFDIGKTINAIIKKVGVKPLNEFHNVEKKKSQSLYFGSKLASGEVVLIATKAMDTGARCKVIIYVRNEKKEIRDLIVQKLF